MTDATAPLPQGLARALRRALEAPAQRVARLRWDGRLFWLKRPEARRSLRWRIQKGDPQRIFRQERAVLEELRARGAPVPRVVAAGPEYLLLEDAGTNLQSLLEGADTSPAEAGRAVEAAVEALARLHRDGLAHGRPYLRDLCWNGSRISMIDFESFRRRNGFLRQGRDLVLFLASLLATPMGTALFPRAMAAWQREAPPASLRGAGIWISLLRPLAPLAQMALKRRIGGREIAGYLKLVRIWPDGRPGAWPAE